jgi:GMP synthase (glutamine-hydrolysing)
MLRTEEYVRGVVASGIPLLGICFGHQLMAQALGGLVARNPRGRELGTVMLEKLPDADEDALFSGLPRSFAVNTSHVDTVVRPPDSARVLARTDRERVAAFGLGGDGQLAWGVQFHPEFDGEVVRGYVRARSPTMAKEGLDPERALESAADAPHGREILRKFLRTVF